MANIDIEKIFTAFPKTTWEFLINDGQGCYIPPYQRTYSWDSDNVSRLFEDAIHGLNHLSRRPETISFLGTIIAIHDTKHRTVYPIYKPEVAPRVMSIIDGQQRLSTFIMLNMVFHNLLDQWSSGIKDDDNVATWLKEECEQLLVDLEKSFLLDRTTGTGNYRFYPRIIRSYKDVWSKREGQAKYESPVARLIWDYINHYKNQARASRFTYKPVDSDGKTIPIFKPVVDVFGYAYKEITRICRSMPSEKDFPQLVSVVSSEDFMDSIWGHAVPDEMRSFIAEKSDHAKYDDYCSILRILIFAKYMNHRMAFTIVVTESEDDAFDMFEALNTTGEPLTAFETFKPRVIEAETLDRFEHSPSYGFIKDIEGYLDAFRKAEQKQKATSDMLIPFALAETGDKLQKKLNGQRRYLRDCFESIDTLDKKRDFVHTMANLSVFMKHGWDIQTDEPPLSSPFKICDEEALIGFVALKQMNHHITLAPLLRFYDAVLRADPEERPSRIDDFVKALKATVAFSMLWRGGKGGTDNIDSHYRDIMRNGVPSKKIPPLAKNPRDKTGVLSLNNYLRALRHFFEEKGGYSDRGSWVKDAHRTPIYDAAKTVSKFLMFCATDDSVPDEASPGLIIRGRRGVAPMLSVNNWNEDSYFSVEHIAPQNSDHTWDRDIYEESSTVHCLGNLTLLPASENSVVGNRPWNEKRWLYKAMSAETKADYDASISELSKIGITLSKKADEVMSRSKYLGMCKSINRVVGDWDKALIEKRSVRIAELAWDRIYPWLGS